MQGGPVEQLLAKVMDLVSKSVDADHGCFMLRDEGGKLAARAVRYREGLSRQEELGVSRTIYDPDGNRRRLPRQSEKLQAIVQHPRRSRCRRT